MDPQTALNTFNNPSTCRAERIDLAIGLHTWLLRGGAKPEGLLSQTGIDNLKKHAPYDCESGEAALAAMHVNELLS